MHTVSHWLVSAKLTAEQQGTKLHSRQASTLTAANDTLKKRHSRHQRRLWLRLDVAMELRKMSSDLQLHTVKIHKHASLSTKIWQNSLYDSSMTRMKGWLSVQKCFLSLRNTVNAFRKYAEECYVPKNLCVQWLIFRLKNQSDPWLMSRLKTGVVGGRNQGDFTALLLLLEFPQHALPFRGQNYDQWLTTKNCKLSSFHIQKYKYLHSNDVKTVKSLQFNVTLWQRNFQAFTDLQW